MSVAQALAAAVGDDIVVAAEDIEPRYLGDWTLNNAQARPAALAKPRSTADVSAILRHCNLNRVPLVAQGGRTGLAGGALPDDGWVILSMERMRQIGPVDTAAATIIAEAGAVLEAVQNAADEAGMFFPLDIGGRGSCTIGGNISTNAGGNRVLRYGMMRDMVLGLEVVLADGTILHSMNTMLKNNSGYDLKQIFVGSEGTLGVVTRAVLRLFPKSTSVQTALCAVADYDATIALLRMAKGKLGANLSAFEAMWPKFYELGTEGMKRQSPLKQGYGLYILVETMGTGEHHDQAQFTVFVEAAYEAGIVQDAVIAQSLKDSEAFWTLRDSSGELQQTMGPYIAFDVSLPIGDIGRYIETCGNRLDARWPGVSVAWFGHVADSNIHICVQKDVASDEHALDTIIYDCVSEFDGSISAEHGIGLLKRDFLDRSRTADEIAAMRRLKHAFDPAGILNPGKVLV